MEVFKKIGSKERLFEMMSGVNKVKINEDVMASEGGLADRAVNELIAGNLDIEQTNNQVNGNESIVEIVGKDDVGSKFVFKFSVTSNETDQQGVNVINDANLMELSGDMPKYTAKFQMTRDDSRIAEINKQYKRQIIDAISEYVEFESDAEAVSDEMFAEAIKFIDKVPYKKGSEEIQTQKAYADQKPVNPDVRVKSPELEKFISEIEEYQPDDDDDEGFFPQGSYTVSNAGGYEIMLNGAGDAAKVRDAFGSDNPETSDWLEIEYVNNEETGEPEPVIDPNGYNIPLNMVMRIQEVDVVQEPDEEEEEDIMALPPDYSPEDMPKPQDADDGSVSTDPYEQEPEYEEGEASQEEKELYSKAYDNLTAAGNKFPTPDQIEKEILNMQGLNKPVEKTRAIPKGAEDFWEGKADVNINTSDVVKQGFEKLLPEDKKKQLIFQAQEIVDEALGDFKSKLPKEVYIENVQKEALQLYREKYQDMNEAEKNDYPDQMGKTFKPKNQMPKKKKQPQSVVKLKEEDDFPDTGQAPDFKSMPEPTPMPDDADAPEIDIEDVSAAKEATGDQLGGGLADESLPNQFDPEQIAMGVKVEMEHTDNPLLAIEIAMDHLTEFPDYYTRLDKMEKEAEADAPEEESGDEELTDELLGFKPMNVGDYANEEFDVPQSPEQERQYWDKEYYKQDQEVEEPADPDVGHAEYLKKSGQMKSFDDASQKEEIVDEYVDMGMEEYQGEVGDRYRDEEGNEFSVSEKTKGGVILRGYGGSKEVATSELKFMEKLNEDVELARAVLKNRRLDEGMTKENAVKLLIRHNIK